MPAPGAGGDDWSGRYLAELTTQRQLSPHTVAAYRRDLAELAALASSPNPPDAAGPDAKPGQPDWTKLTPADIRRFAGKLHAAGQSATTIARKLSGWRGFYTWLSHQAASGATLGGTPLGTPLAANPVDGIRAPRRPRRLPKALSVDVAVQLMEGNAHAHPEPAELCNRAMFELLYSSGLRVAELAGLDVQHAPAQGMGAASLGWLELDAQEVIVTGKGGKMRRVPVGGPARDALAAWLAVRPPASDGSQALFLSTRGTRISPRVVQLRLKAHAQKVGLPMHVHPHVLRHSFASHVLQSSGDLRAVQELLGHASITSTQIYTSLDFQHLAAVYDSAHPRAKRKE
jgi:integrase/recombinase XerC